MKNNLVKVIENVQNNHVQTITPTMVDGVLKFRATLGNGAKEMVSDKWLKENFCTLYNYFYDELHDEENHGTKLDLSEGHIEMSSNCEMDDSAGLEMNQFGFLGMGCPKEWYTSGRVLVKDHIVNHANLEILSIVLCIKMKQKENLIST
eukprot:14600368-Ditylum_brightwellii.AAC.1